MKKTFAAASLAATLAIGSIVIAVTNPFENEADASANTPIYGVMVAQTANNTHMSTDGALMDVIDQVNLTGGQINITLASSKPETLCSGIEVPVLPEVTDNRLTGRIEAPDSPLAPMFLIDTAVPKNTEINYVESFRMSSSQINSQENQDSGRDKVLYVFGSGIDTANEKLSFTKGILSSDYKAIIDEMESLGVLPNLEGVTVVWIGLTTTADPQMQVPYEYVPIITDLWTYFLEKCGVQSMTFQDSVATDEVNTTDDGYPYVTPVPFAPTATNDWWINEYVSLSEGVLGFEPESTVPRDGEAAARSILLPHAEALCRSGQVIVICASAWNDGTGDEIALSRDRAEWVRDVLVEMGVPSSQLIIAAAGNLGTNISIAGQTVDFYFPDLPEASRAVHFIPTDNGKADDVLSRFGVS